MSLTVNEAVTESNRIYVRAQPPDTISVPQHREIAKGTLKSILRQLGLSVEDFVDLVRDCRARQLAVLVGIKIHSQRI